MFKEVKDLLGDRINKLGLQGPTDGATVVTLWNKYASQIFLSSVMSQSEAINFRNGVLTIMAGNPICAQEIMYQQYKIINQINKELGRETVKRIRFR